MIQFSVSFSISVSSLLASVVSISTCCANTFAQTQFSVTEIYNFICLCDKVYCLAFLILVRGEKKERKKMRKKNLHRKLFAFVSSFERKRWKETVVDENEEADERQICVSVSRSEMITK